MKRIILMGASLLASGVLAKQSYSGKSYNESCFASFSIKNETVSRQLIALNRLYHFNWLQPHEGPNFDVGTFATILVHQEQKNELFSLLGNDEITLNCNIDDLITNSFSRSETDQNYRQRSRNQSWTLDDWNNWDEIEDYLHHISIEKSDYARLKSIGKSHEGRDLWRLDIGINATNMPSIAIDCGVHAREWLSPAFCLYLIDQLLNDSSFLKEGLNWIIYPMLNPDGYVYTWDADRLWRKNRRPRSNDPGASFCEGVDLNRNYGAGWKTNAEIDQEIVETLKFNPLYEALDDPCENIYRGTEPFSEPETRAHMDDMQKTENIIGYVTYHSYGELILYPLGMNNVSLKTSQDDMVQLESIAKEMQGAIKSVHNHTYQYGEIKEILYEAPGSCVDWVFLEENIPLSFGIELRPAKGSDGFRSPGFFIKHHEIIPTGEENLAGLTVLYNRTNTNATISCDCKTNDCQYFNDDNTVDCVDANGGRKSSSANNFLFFPFILITYLV